MLEFKRRNSSTSSLSNYDKGFELLYKLTDYKSNSTLKPYLSSSNLPKP